MKINFAEETFRLKDHVELLNSSGEVELLTKSGKWTLHSDYGLDFNELIRQRRVMPLEVEESSLGLFLKVLKILIDDDLITIDLKSGLAIKSIHWNKFKSLWEKSLNPVKETMSVSPGVVISSSQHGLKLIDTTDETVVSIPQREFFKAINDTSGDLSIQLALLGFLNRSESNGSGDESINDAFHILTSRDLVPKKFPEYQMQIPWKGSARESALQNNLFIETMKKRRSLKSKELFQKPSLDVLKRFLETVYGATTDSNGASSFFYPSPGRGYSVRLRVLYPSQEGTDLYEYDPLAKELSKIGSYKKLMQDPDWIRLICVGDTLELQKRYNLISYRLLLLETGVILQQLSLVAAHLGLSGKIIGYTDEKVLKQTFSGSFTKPQKILGEYVLTEVSRKEVSE